MIEIPWPRDNLVLSGSEFEVRAGLGCCNDDAVGPTCMVLRGVHRG
jgi:hypothetical protein